MIQADQAMNLQVKGNLNIQSTTQSSQNALGQSNYSWTGIDRIAGLYVGSAEQQALSDQPTLVMNVGVTLVYWLQISRIIAVDKRLFVRAVTLK